MRELIERLEALNEVSADDKYVVASADFMKNLKKELDKTELWAKKHSFSDMKKNNDGKYAISWVTTGKIGNNRVELSLAYLRDVMGYIGILSKVGSLKVEVEKGLSGDAKKDYADLARMFVRELLRMV